MEIWDAYNNNFEKIKDKILIRGETIPDGIYHLVSEVIVRHVDGDYLLMQRDINKKFGGMWEATAGGSALQNENAIECAIRELYEETGIKSINLTEIGRIVSEADNTLYVEFLCITDCKKNCIALREGETSDYKWITKQKLISMEKQELATKRIQKFVDELK